MKHFLVNDLFYQKQSGFKPNHSCHTALTELIDTWLSEISINKLCGALFTDFAKAFDVINCNRVYCIHVPGHDPITFLSGPFPF